MKNNSQKGFVVPIIIAIVVILIAVVAYVMWQKGKVVTAIDNQVVATTTQVTIMVPNDMAAYSKAMSDFTQVSGGVDPSKTFPFVEKMVSVAPTTDVVLASAEAAAEVIPTQASSLPQQIVYLKVVNGTAYVVLAMDIDGWAGVSVAIANVHPLVEKTLLNLPGITSVKFGPAPEDTIDSITKAYSAPAISTITPSSGPIGTTIELKGRNLAGFEGNLDAWIVNSNGETAFLPGIGTVPRANQTIRVKIDGQLCKQDNNMKGGQCTSFLTITPGIYGIYTMPWGNKSNVVNFTVTQSVGVVSSTSDWKTSTDLLKTWKTYTNDKYHFSLMTPAGVAIDETATQKGYSYSVVVGPIKKIQINIEDPHQDLAYGPACNTSAGGNPSQKNINGVMFSSINVSKFFSTNANTSATIYCVVHNGYGFTIIPQSVYGHETPVNVDVDVTLNLILSTFKFTN